MMTFLQHPDNTAMFNSVETCPIKNVLWFHNLPWTHPMPKPPNYTPGLAADAMSTNDTVTLYVFDAACLCIYMPAIDRSACCVYTCRRLIDLPALYIHAGA